MTQTDGVAVGLSSLRVWKYPMMKRNGSAPMPMITRLARESRKTVAGSIEVLMKETPTTLKRCSHHTGREKKYFRSLHRLP